MIGASLSRLLRSRSGAAWCALALVLASNTAFTPGFMALELQHGRWFGALVDIAHRGAPVMLLALGQAIVIGTGGVDLSVGSTMALASSVAAVMLTGTRLGGDAAISAALASGLAVGAFNGWLVGALRVQAIVATLVTLSLARGLAELLSGSGIRAFHRDDLQFLSNGSLLGLSSSIWIAAVCFAATSIVLATTTL